MFEKIKQYVYGGVGAIFVALLGVVYALSRKNAALESKNAELRGENELGKVTGDYEKQKDAADSAESDYTRIRDQFKSSSDPESDS